MMKINILLLLLTVFMVESAISAIPNQQTGFPFNLPNSTLVRSSSTNVADLSGDNIPEIVVGDANGTVHAINSNGTIYWQHDTGDTGIEAKVAIADMDLDGVPEVIVTAGSFQSPIESEGSLTILNGQTGQEICKYVPPRFNNDHHGIYGSAAVANLDKSDNELEIAIGSFGAIVVVLNHDCSILWQSQQPPAVTGQQLPNGYNESIPPFTVYVNDTVGSSPAIADINKDGQLDVIIGVSSHIDDNGLTPNGGRLLVINGNNGTLIFAKNVDEVFSSSPVIADLDNDGSLDIIVGTGYCWQNEPCSPGNGTQNDGNQLYAWDANGNDLAGWPFNFENLGGSGVNYALNENSVAVADVDNDGFLEVFINAFKPAGGHPFDGIVIGLEHNAILKWATIPLVPISQTDFVSPSSNETSPIIADINNDGVLDIVVASNFEPIVYNSIDGTQLTSSSPNIGTNDFSMRTKFTISSTLSFADIDNDNDYELISAGSDPTAGFPTTFNIWDLDTPVDGNNIATSSRLNPKNTALYVIDKIFKHGFE